MPHFAEVSYINQVLRVVSFESEYMLDAEGNESEQVGIDFLKGLFGEDTRWVQTSPDGSFRGSFAQRGGTYHESRQVFIPAQPYPSWVLNEDTLEWEAPIPKPED